MTEKDMDDDLSVSIKRWKMRLQLSIGGLILFSGIFVVAVLATPFVGMWLMRDPVGATTPDALAQAISAKLKPWFVCSIIGAIAFLITALCSFYNYLRLKQRNAT